MTVRNAKSGWPGAKLRAFPERGLGFLGTLRLATRRRADNTPASLT